MFDAATGHYVAADSESDMTSDGLVTSCPRPLSKRSSLNDSEWYSHEGRMGVDDYVLPNLLKPPKLDTRRQASARTARIKNLGLFDLFLADDRAGGCDFDTSRLRNGLGRKLKAMIAVLLAQTC